MGKIVYKVTIPYIDKKQDFVFADIKPNAVAKILLSKFYAHFEDMRPEQMSVAISKFKNSLTDCISNGACLRDLMEFVFNNKQIDIPKEYQSYDGILENILESYKYNRKSLNAKNE